MVATPSAMLPLGTQAPGFRLRDTDGTEVDLADFRTSRGVLVMFICNHCPYVKHVRTELARLGQDLKALGVGVVAINANDAEAYPADAPERMVEEKAAAGYDFPYLFDDTQEVARAYRAACTPDFFLLNDEHRLVYRGQLDGSRPGNGIPVTGEDVRAAVAAMLAGDPVAGDQRPSIGCNIKWKR